MPPRTLIGPVEGHINYDVQRRVCPTSQNLVVGISLAIIGDVAVHRRSYCLKWVALKLCAEGRAAKGDLK